jgi:hypothetical protein
MRKGQHWAVREIPGFGYFDGADFPWLDVFAAAE